MEQKKYRLVNLWAAPPVATHHQAVEVFHHHPSDARPKPTPKSPCNTNSTRAEELPQVASQAVAQADQADSAKPQVDNKSAASQSEEVRQVLSDAQDALDKAVQVSHNQDLLVPMAVSAKSPVDNK